MRNRKSAGAKSGTPAATIASGDLWDHWWNRSPLMVRNEYGYYTARPGAEFWYDNFWMPRMLSAWTYELVRRLARLKLQQPQLSREDQELVRSLPPYPRLTREHRRLLSSVWAGQFKSEVPHLRLGATARWQHGQIFKLGDWRLIEALDRKTASETEPDARARAFQYLRRYWPLVRGACRTLRAGGCPVHFERRPRHELSDCGLTPERLAELLREVCSRAS